MYIYHMGKKGCTYVGSNSDSSQGILHATEWNPTGEVKKGAYSAHTAQARLKDTK